LKIITLISSYRKNGNTARVVQILEEQLRTLAAQNNIQVDFETVFLSHANLQICRGCRVCFDQGEDKCPFQDDLLSIKAKLADSGFLILATPVYVEDVNGIMKLWIDRMAFHSHRPEFGGKTAYILSTSGSGSTSHTLTTMKNALRTWGFSIAGQATFTTGALMKKEEIAALYQEKINRIAAKILHAIHSNMGMKPTFISLLFFRVEQLYYQRHQAEESFDLSYWRGKGWLESTSHYYFKTKANPLKIGMVHLMGSIIAKFVLK
jgi:multimeric flavodoxin WrbA